MRQTDARGRYVDRGPARGILHGVMARAQSDRISSERYLQFIAGQYLGPAEVSPCRVWKRGRCRIQAPYSADEVQRVLTRVVP